MYNPDIICENLEFSKKQADHVSYVCSKNCDGMAKRPKIVPLPSWWWQTTKVGSAQT
jgi:hypothetical protein